MARKKEIKTNAMRILEQMNIPFMHLTYECREFEDGIQIADLLGLPHEKVFKTLVTVGAGNHYFVFVIPIEAELDMKAAARAVGEKSVSMIHVKEINKVTGYVRFLTVLPQICPPSSSAAAGSVRRSSLHLRIFCTHPAGRMRG